MRFAILGYGKIASEVMFQSILAAGHAVTVIGSERGLRLMVLMAVSFAIISRH